MTQLKSLADAPGTRREYETIYILRPTITNDDVAEVNNRVRGIIEGLGGKVLKVDNWGKRRLAYEVQKERKGIYLYWQYLAGPGIVDEFERNMRMLDSVIRYMTVKLDTDIDPDTRPSEVTDETYEKAANTAADEEDMFLRPHDEGGSSADGEATEAKSDGDGAKADGAKADEAKPEEAKSEEAKSEEAKPEEAKADEPKAEEAKPEEAKPDEPATKTDEAASSDDSSADSDAGDKE